MQRLAAPSIAGGGGKALAFADQTDAQVFAHDIAADRMRDLPARAARAGVNITPVVTADLAQGGSFDVVFCDAPCSGSGTWRRTPDAKWRLSADRLAALQVTQREVLDQAAQYVGPGGTLVYATCSVLTAENDALVDAFVAEADDWQIKSTWQHLPDPEGDGFFLCQMRRR